MIKYLYYFLFSFFLVLLQQSFFTAFDFFSNLNILLVFLVFITIIFGFNLGFIFALFIGLILSIYSLIPWGSVILIYLVVLLIINFLYKNILTNLSFYTSLIMIILATLLYVLLVLLVFYLAYLADLNQVYIAINRGFWDNLIDQLILNTGLMALLFLIARFTYKKLNLAFLLKK